MSTRRTVSGIVVAAGLLLGGGIAAGALAATGAAAATDSPSPSPSATGDADRDGRPEGRDGRGHRGGPMGAGRMPGARDVDGGRTLHGELVVQDDDGSTHTVLVQHGSVTATTSDTVTVRSSDGFTTTWKVTSDTRLMLGRPDADASSSLDDITTGADVVVSGPKTSDGATATRLGVRPEGLPDGDHHPKPSPSATTSSASLSG